MIDPRVILGVGVLLVVTIAQVIIKKKFKIDVWWEIKSAVMDNMFPAKTIVLQVLSGRSYLLKMDKEKRVENKGAEYMKSLREGTRSPPVDYSMYIPTAQGKKWMMECETDKGERYPLRPITCEQVFMYDTDGKIVCDELGKPIVRDEFYALAKSSSKETVLGLKALSKGRREWYLMNMEKAALKHPMKKDNSMLLIAGTMFVFMAIGAIVFYQALPQVAQAASELPAVMP